MSWRRNLLGISPENTGGGGGGVTQIVAGTNVTVDPPTGVGVVTVNAVVPTASPESFSAYVSEDRSIPTNVGYSNTFFPWTWTLDTVAFPGISPECFFNTLNEGVFDVSNGIFTCGVSGTYSLFAFVYSIQSCEVVVYNVTTGSICSFLNIAGSSAPIMLELTAGIQYQFRIYNPNAPVVIPYSVQYDSLGNDGPNVIFSLSLMQGAGSGGGVQSVVAGSGISVDNTDPENPVVSTTGGGSGVESVTGGSGITVDNTDPLNPIVENAGVLSVLDGDGVGVDNTDPQNPVVFSQLSSGFNARLTGDITVQNSGFAFAGPWETSGSFGGLWEIASTGWDNTTGLYTAPSTGIYQINAGFWCVGFGGSSVNGTAIAIASPPSYFPYLVATSPAGVSTMSASVFLTAGDRVWMQGNATGGTGQFTVYQLSTIPSGYGTGTWFSVYRVGSL